MIKSLPSPDDVVSVFSVCISTHPPFASLLYICSVMPQWVDQHVKAMLDVPSPKLLFHTVNNNVSVLSITFVSIGYRCYPFGSVDLIYYYYYYFDQLLFCTFYWGSKGRFLFFSLSIGIWVIWFTTSVSPPWMWRTHDIFFNPFKSMLDKKAGFLKM